MLPADRRRRLRAALCLAAAGTFGAVFSSGFILTAAAQTAAYPTKPVRLVIPYPPGGTTDLVGRLLGQELGSRLGQNFIADNRGGAGGQIGTDLVAKAVADGYTLLVAASGNLMMQPALSPTLPYNAISDFDPIGNIVNVPNLMVVSAASKFTSIKTFIDAAKANPGKIRYASGGTGSSGHIAGALFSTIAGVDMLHVPYRGGGLSIVSVMSGETDVNFVNLPTALPHIRSGKLRGITVLSTKRATMAPEFPTTVELGIPGVVMTSSTGLLAPTGVPKPILSRLESALRSIADNPEVNKQFANLGADLDYMDAAQYRSYIRDEIKRFSELGKRANISIN